MAGTFEQAVGTWQGFYSYLGAVAATLLGLLFVAVSLRLNLFKEQQVRDVRDFAFLTFATFFSLILVAGLFLIPNQSRIGVGLPLMLLGLLGIGGFAFVAREAYGINQGPHALAWWAWAAYALGVLTYMGLAVVGLLLLGANLGALGWLVPVDAGLLTTATLSSWTLLSHA